MQTYEPSDAFDFSKISLANPRPIQGGAFFAKLSVNDNDNFYVQLPKCLTKQGIIITKRGKYSDLLYTRNGQETLANWILTLETTCQDLIYQKREIWFHNDLTRDDIETMMSPVFRLYKSGQQLLIRTHLDVNRQTGLAKCLAYDESECKIDLDKLDIQSNIIPLICIDGIKLSSKSFEIDIKLIQLMVLDPEPEPTEVCLIKNSILRSHANSVSLGITKPTITNIPEDVKGHHKVDNINTVKDPEFKPNIKTEDATASVAGATDMTENEEANESVEAGVEEPVEANESVETGVETTESAEPVEAEVEANESAEQVEANESVEPVKAEVEVETEEKVEAEVNSNAQDVNDNSDTLNTEDRDYNNNLPLLDAASIEEVHPVISDDDDGVTLKDPNEVYYEIYRAARNKAKQMRRMAMEAYLEARDIKTKYLLNDIEDSDEEEEEDIDN